VHFCRCLGAIISNLAKQHNSSSVEHKSISIQSYRLSEIGAWLLVRDLLLLSFHRFNARCTDAAALASYYKITLRKSTKKDLVLQIDKVNKKYLLI